MSHSWFRTGKHTFYSDTSDFQTILSFWGLTTSKELSLLYCKFSRYWIFFPTKQNLPLNKESRVTLLDCSNERIEKIIGTIFTLYLLCGFKLLSQFQIPSKYFKFLFTQNNLLKLLIHFFQQTLPKEFSNCAQRRKATLSKHQAAGYFKIDITVHLSS